MSFLLVPPYKLLVGAGGAAMGTDPAANDREFSIMGAFGPLFISETGTRSESLAGGTYLTETS